MCFVHLTLDITQAIWETFRRIEDCTNHGTANIASVKVAHGKSHLAMPLCWEYAWLGLF